MGDLERQEINPDLLRERYARLLEERSRSGELIGRLQAALRDAIMNPTRVRNRFAFADPTGATYAVEWTDQVRAWADLCCLDLDEMEPAAYADY